MFLNNIFRKFDHRPQSEKNFTVDSPPSFYYCLHRRLIPLLNNTFCVIIQKKVIFSCSHCSLTIFILPSYSLHTQAMPILILINVQYLQITVFSFEKGLNGQKYSSSDSHQPIKQFPSP